MMSGAITSLVVLLIIVFLFGEGLSLFSTSPVENNNAIAVNKGNPVVRLKPSQIKDIFDEKITNWKGVGGNDDSIIILTPNTISQFVTEESLGANSEFLPIQINKITDSLQGVFVVFNQKYFENNF